MIKDYPHEAELDVTNEEEALASVIDQITKAMKATSYRYEILVVDDGSRDRTANIAEEKGVRLVKHARQKGSGAARRTGVAQAKGEIVAVLDADGTYSPEDIPKLLEMFPEYDQVNGHRTSEAGTLKFLRAPVKYLIRKLACYLSKTDIPDLNTGLKVFKRDIMLRYLWVIPDGFSCVTTMTLAFLCNGYNVGWVKTGYHSRLGKSKFHPIKDTYQYLLTVIRLILYFNPLSVFFPAGSVFVVLGLIHWAFVKLTEGEGVFLGPVLVTIGFLMFVLGFLADLIVAQTRSITHTHFREGARQ